MNVKLIDIREFREKGYLQELNRQFLHPLGLALSISIDENGEEYLGGIWDYRNDPEGMLYSDDIISSDKFKDNIEYIKEQWNQKEKTRTELHGFMIQE